MLGPCRMHAALVHTQIRFFLSNKYATSASEEKMHPLTSYIVIHHVRAHPIQKQIVFGGARYTQIIFFLERYLYIVKK